MNAQILQSSFQRMYEKSCTAITMHPMTGSILSTAFASATPIRWMEAGMASSVPAKPVMA